MLCPSIFNVSKYSRLQSNIGKWRWRSFERVNRSLRSGESVRSGSVPCRWLQSAIIRCLDESRSDPSASVQQCFGCVCIWPGHVAMLELWRTAMARNKQWTSKLFDRDNASPWREKCNSLSDDHRDEYSYPWTIAKAILWHIWILSNHLALLPIPSIWPSDIRSIGENIRWCTESLFLVARMEERRSLSDRSETSALERECRSLEDACLRWVSLRWVLSTWSNDHRWSMVCEVDSIFSFCLINEKELHQREQTIQGHCSDHAILYLFFFLTHSEQLLQESDCFFSSRALSRSFWLIRTGGKGEIEQQLDI